jgi:hypothetical protein
MQLNCKWIFTQWQWYYNKTEHKNTHITQTIKDTLQTMDITQKSKAVPLAGCGGI